MKRKKQTVEGFSSPTLADIARQTGFSISTVSIVLNEAPLSRYIAAKTKEHIRKVAKSMDYRPHAFARSLRRQRSQTIGVMISDISDPFCTLILQGIEKALYSTGFLPILMDTRNQRIQLERYLAMSLEYRVEGLIIVANWVFNDIDLSGLERHRIPTLMVGSEMRAGSVGSVLVDNEQGGYIALQYLYSLGHRKIAFIRGPRQLKDSIRRWEGVLRFAAEYDLKLCREWVVDLKGSADPNSNFEEGRSLTHAMLERKPGFTALMAFDDLTAFGAARALREAGRRVPEDCSLLGFDDVPYAALSSPGLSTVRQSMERMGTIAVERILKVIQDGENTGRPKGLVELMPPELVPRESTMRVSTKRALSAK